MELSFLIGIRCGTNNLGLKLFLALVSNFDCQLWTRNLKSKRAPNADRFKFRKNTEDVKKSRKRYLVMFNRDMMKFLIKADMIVTDYQKLR